MSLSEQLHRGQQRRKRSEKMDQAKLEQTKSKQLTMATLLRRCADNQQT